MSEERSGSGGAIASYGHIIATTLDELGVDSEPVFVDAGVRPSTSVDPLHRLSNRDISRLFEASVQATGDPYFGLLVGRNVQPSIMHAFGLGVLASTTLNDFLDRIANYYRLVSRAAKFKHRETDGHTILYAEDMRDNVCDETADAWAVVMVRLMRLLYQREINPVWIELLRPCPEPGDKPYVDIFKCPVRFNCSELRIAMDSSIMDRRLPGASPELAQYNDQIAMRYLEKLDEQNLSNRVRSMIVSQLATGKVSKLRIADQLHMGPRSLQLKLAAEDTTFQDILDTTRQSLAQSYIEQSGLSITEIAFLLGFADASNFTRAFKRWSGKSPSEYRDNH